MANDGIKIILTLKQIDLGTGLPTGLTKNNVITDPNYIAPYTDLTACPISYSLACPIVVATAWTGSILYEFSTYNSVVTNPNVLTVRVTSISQSNIINTVNYTLPNATGNYFSGSISASLGTYTLNVSYVSGSTVLTTCTGSASYSVIH